MNITIFGTGYVGLVSGACLAEVGHNVVCMDVDHVKIEKLKVGIQPNMLVTLDGGEDVEVPINFRDGIKSLFIVQDIAGELL